MKTEFTKQWILTNGIPIVKSYGGNLTLRGLHYRLVALGMINDLAHYHKVVNAMIDARWSGEIEFDDLLDHERQTIGETKAEQTDVESKVAEAKEQIHLWATSYRKNRWENQPIYPEVFIEKKALQGVFEKLCKDWNIALNPCKGYPSLTYIYQAYLRYSDAAIRGQELVMLYFGDYDPSGENIPETIKENLSRMGVDIEIRRVALYEQQVLEWGLPPAPTKMTDSRSRSWTGLGQVELDAVEPHQIQSLCLQAIKEIFDENLHMELLDQERGEKVDFKNILKRDFKTLL